MANKPANKMPGEQRPSEAATAAPSDGSPANSDPAAPYIPYPLAFKRLNDRLGDVTAHEIAAWVFFGPGVGGLAAYLNANELPRPPRFYFSPPDANASLDYVGPLMACWFSERAISEFKPADRYITGAALIKRWSGQPGLADPKSYIAGTIKQSRLVDVHPICGGIHALDAADDGLPTIEEVLFSLAAVKEIETTDFGSVLRGDWAESPDARFDRLNRRVEKEKGKRTKAFLKVVASDEGISVTRLKQILRRGKNKSSPSQSSWPPVSKATSTPSSRKAASPRRKV